MNGRGGGGEGRGCEGKGRSQVSWRGGDVMGGEGTGRRGRDM